jgi:hypothetical protein
MVTKHFTEAPSYIPHLISGVSYMDAIISSIISLGVGFGAGWYVKGRGMTGVQNDLNNIKNDITNIKAKVGV